MSLDDLNYQRGEKKVRKWVDRGDLASAIQFCEQQISLLPKSDYHTVIGRSWLEKKDSAADWLARFHSHASADFAVRALYCEMNRFEINTDQWHVDAFAYDAIGDPKVLGWLVGWKCSSYDSFTLDGMEDLQAAFARDIGELETCTPTMDWTILLLTLRMQELIAAACEIAWTRETLPAEVPVYATAHDFDMLSLAATDAGKRELSKARRVALKAPPPVDVRVDGERGPGVYKMEPGSDSNHNSLPWDLLRYHDESTDLRQLDTLQPRAASWQPCLVNYVRRKWRCDILGLYPNFVVNEHARQVLEPLLAGQAEFLTVECPQLSEPLAIMHPLRHIPLGSGAETNARHPEDVITVIRTYDFEPDDLQGLAIFRISQPADSHAGKDGFPCTGIFVSDDFVHAIEESGLRGVVFKKVASS